ncbi:hypothetical protein LUZ63_021344 [Rhynchospora breviuscula]|uniref:glucose-6-phosphate dehydrogenase (NADP(+)) n=1 Tax=Rhynchospora breviuscula TaxID=2022672 RepID=A0A9P9Z890_9POAL|nr:hypothetical protein LUZ63_021344 [Rhynchospora breviuscula]
MTDTQTTLIVLGASGDLTSRLLMPALGQLLTREPDHRIRLIGAGMDDWDDAKWREVVTASFATVDAAGPAVSKVLAEATYRTADITDAKDLEMLLGLATGRPAFYFAVPPAVAAKACDALSSVTIPDGLILALEKPFGTDEESAHALNQKLAGLVPEDQVHRIDHFLGRSTVLNVLGVRFTNRIFEPVWSAEHIESVVIRYDEALGLEGRAGYYDKAGALVDMIQSHLLQVLAVVAMDPPSTLDAMDFRDAKAVVLRATSPWNGDPAANSRRARYTAGSVGDRHFPSYVDEEGVDPANMTETLAEMTVGIATSRWAGVPFTLRSGKALGDRRSEIVITFKPVTHLPTGFEGSEEKTVLRLTLGPDKMALELNINGPGDPFSLERASLEASFGEGELLAYAEVLQGILEGDPTLSVRGDTAEQCWHIVQPVLDASDERASGHLRLPGWRDPPVSPAGLGRSRHLNPRPRAVGARSAGGDHREHVAGGVGEPRDVGTPTAGDAFVVGSVIGVDVDLRDDSAAVEGRRRRPPRRRREVQDRERRRLVVGLGVHQDLSAAGQAQAEEAHVVVDDVETEHVAVERTRRVDVVDGEAAEGLTGIEHGSSLPAGARGRPVASTIPP